MIRNLLIAAYILIALGISAVARASTSDRIQSPQVFTN